MLKHLIKAIFFVGLLAGPLWAAPTSAPFGSVSHTLTSSGSGITVSCDPANAVTEWDITMSHSVAAPQLTLGGNCITGQTLVLRQIQDATGGITPTVTNASGVTLNWQATPGGQPSFTTTANASDIMRFTMSSSNLILVSWLPNSAPSLAVVGSPCTNQAVTALGTTGPACNTITSAYVDTSVAVNVFNTTAATNFNTAISSPVTLVTSAPVNEAINISSAGLQTLAGVGCSSTANTVTVTFAYTSPNGSAKTASPTVFSITGNGSTTQQQTAATNLVIQSGTAVTYTTAVSFASTGCSTVPQYTYYFHVSL